MNLKDRWTTAIKIKGSYTLRHCSQCHHPLALSYVNGVLGFNSACGCGQGGKWEQLDESELYFYLMPDYGYLSDIEKFIKHTEVLH